MTYTQLQEGHSIEVWNKDGITNDPTIKVYKNGALNNTGGKWEHLVIVRDQPSRLVVEPVKSYSFSLVPQLVDPKVEANKEDFWSKSFIEKFFSENVLKKGYIGQIADMKVWDKSLSTEEVRRHYSGHTKWTSLY